MFIPRNYLEGRGIGQWVQLTRDVDILAGRFTKGTRMQIIADGARGLDLEDAEGNKLFETGILGDFFEPVKPNQTDW